jgi:anti-sigma regulatory factor (Ser/Thr protein kinase)
MNAGPASYRHSPAQNLQHADLRSAASDRPSGPPGPSASLPAAVRTGTEDVSDSDEIRCGLRDLVLRHRDPCGHDPVSPELASPNRTASFPVPQEWDVEPDLQAVPGARRLVAEIARSWGVPLPEDAFGDIELCASEIIANAIEHTGARCRVTVHWTGERLRVEVADASLRLPQVAAAGDGDTSGRGLRLVQEFANAWGWEPVGTGKRVWFEVCTDQTAVAGD